VADDLAYCASSIACARAEGYEVVICEGPLPPLSERDATKREQAFLKALEGAGKPGSRYSLWAAQARDDWHVRTGTPRRAE
jgi:hypothetical protein